MTKRETRYHVFGDFTGWSEFHAFFNLKTDALKFAKVRVNLGYQVMLEDKKLKRVYKVKIKK